ncbi:hypothetical protein ACFW04_012290 [Cataglyphis niger]
MSENFVYQQQLQRSIEHYIQNFKKMAGENHFDSTSAAYHNVLDHMSKILEKLEPVVSPNSSLSSMRLPVDASAFSLSQFPLIKLPLFTTLIIRNPDIIDFSRMHFLLSCLKDRALAYIANISITANFEIAWNALISRYENKRRSINTYLSTLLNLSHITYESSEL